MRCVERHGLLATCLAHECVDPAHARLRSPLRLAAYEKRMCCPSPGNARPEVDVGEHRDARFVQQPLAQLFGILRSRRCGTLR